MKIGLKIPTKDVNRGQVGTLILYPLFAALASALFM